MAGDKPVGKGDYVVRDGDCMTSISEATGHFWETIWNDSNNVDVKTERKDPNVLLKGDRLTIPPLRPKTESCAVNKLHKFRRKGVPAKLMMRVMDDGEPRKNQPYRVNVDGKLFSGTTDANGKIEINIPCQAKMARVIVGPPGDEIQYDLKLGNLPPLSTLKGVQERLTNLGYDCQPANGQMGPRTRDAIVQFQRDNNLQASGEMDDPTRAKLQQVHGS